MKCNWLWIGKGLMGNGRGWWMRDCKGQGRTEIVDYVLWIVFVLVVLGIVGYFLWRVFGV